MFDNGAGNLHLTPPRLGVHQLNVDRNTFLTYAASIEFTQFVQTTDFRFTNNLTRGHVSLQDANDTMRDAASNKWSFSGNVYARTRPEYASTIPVSREDFVVPDLDVELSQDSGSYARVMTSATGKESVINNAGALPPGPAPAEGDWFTRLRERWRDVLEENQDSSDTSPEDATK